jgi:phospholipase/carboxylesterase
MTIRLSPADGAPVRALFILLHGVGANSASLVSLAQRLQVALPSAAFALLQAPSPSDIGAQGFQWFSVRGVTEANRGPRIEAALPLLKAAIAEELAYARVSPEHLIVGGFSQGAMMSLALADNESAIAGIVSIAGRLARLPNPVVNRAPRILLTHGDADQIVPFSALGEATDAFRQAGFDITALPMANLGHQISDAQIDAIATFSHEALFVPTSMALP